MITEIIQGHKVEFDPIIHKYYVDGVLVPSVSEICKKENPFMYAGVNDTILAKAAEKGVNLHKEIENYELYGEVSSSPELYHYMRIKKELDIKKDLTEKMILIKHEGRVVCAGRFDLLADVEGIPTLIDFKRTSQIHLKYVKLQLNLYRIGLIQSFSKEVQKLMMVRLRNHEVNIINIPLEENNTYNILKKY